MLRSKVVTSVRCVWRIWCKIEMMEGHHVRNRLASSKPESESERGRCWAQLGLSLSHVVVAILYAVSSSVWLAHCWIGRVCMLHCMATRDIELSAIVQPQRICMYVWIHVSKTVDLCVCVRARARVCVCCEFVTVSVSVLTCICGCLSMQACRRMCVRVFCLHCMCMHLSMCMVHACMCVCLLVYVYAGRCMFVWIERTWQICMSLCVRLSQLVYVHMRPCTCI